MTVVASYAAAEFAEGSPEVWLLFICPHTLLSKLHRGNGHRRGLPREEASRVLARYERKVAAEADLNIGSVRHFFGGHEDLLAAAAQEAGDRMGRRLEHHPVEQLRGLTGEKALNALQDLLEQVLPVDEPRKVEAIVVLEFIRASRTQAVFASSAA